MRGMEVGMVIFALAILVTLIIGAVILYERSRVAKRETAFRRLATQRSGRYSEGGMFSFPSAQFAYPAERAPVVVSMYSTGGKHATLYTQVQTSWPDATLRCEIYPEGFFSRMGLLIGVQDIQIGRPSFDDNYVLTGNRPEDLTKLISPPVQKALHDLRALFGNMDIYVSISGGRLLIKKKGVCYELAVLERLVNLSLQLYEQMLGARGEGIEFVDSLPASISLEEATCQVCGEQVAEDVVWCRRCNTPHHKDCWNYYGACATYGCKESRFRSAPQ